MAKIVHRPKPEVIVAPDYNKVLQDVKPAPQVGMQARAEQEQARSRFDQALQKAAGKGEQNPLRSSSSEKAAPGGVNRAMEKNLNPTTAGSHNVQGRGSDQQQLLLPAKNGAQEPGFPEKSVERSTEKNSTEINKSPEAKARQSQETNAQRSLQSGFRPHDLCKVAKSDEDDSTSDTSLEGLACPSPPGLQESLSAGAEVAPLARATNFSQFETIESMLNHLSLMTARYGPRDWTFEIQNEQSSLVSVSMAPAANGGWNVAVTAKEEDQSGAQQYLDELQAMLEDTDIASLQVKDTNAGPMKNQDNPRR